MDKLQLTQRLQLESGTAYDSRLITTAGLTGELGRLVSWIDSAYEDIQDLHPDWDFLRYDFSFNTINNQSTYDPDTVITGTPALANWHPDIRCYQTAVTNEQWLDYICWDDFKASRLYGANRSVKGRPFEYSIKPDKKLILWPTPDNVYAINGEYFSVAQVMVDDTDTPVFNRHHMVIVFNALMRYAAYAQEPSVYANAQKEYDRLINKLRSDRKKRIFTGTALA